MLLVASYPLGAAIRSLLGWPIKRPAAWANNSDINVDDAPLTPFWAAALRELSGWLR